jgi:long-chain acyl-CoA synthetase
MTETIAAILDRAELLYADNTAAIDGDTRRTYRELANDVYRLDSALDAVTPTQGGVVGLLALNSYTHLLAWLGVPRSGRVLNALNTRLSTAELSFILDDSGASTLIVDDAFADQGAELALSCPKLRTVVHTGSLPTPDGLTSLEELLGDARPRAALPVAESDIAGVFYTGGTTGLPKGVMLSHRNLVTNAKHALLLWGFDATDRYLHAAPMFHLADGAATLALTWVGGAHVVVPAFDPSSWCETVTRHRVTRATLVPTMINRLLVSECLTETDLSSLRSIAYGGSAMPRALITKAMDYIPCSWGQVFGMTECSGIATFLDHEDHRLAQDGESDALVRLGSAGRPAIGVEVAIRGVDGSLVKTGATGEIVIRSSTVMAGYLDRAEETASALDENGWYRTGDIGRFDDAGYLYVVDRLKDMIITGGENVYTAEVEAALLEHPSVFEAAVFGIPHSDWGESVHAAIVLLPNHTTEVEEIIQHARTLIARYKVPRELHVIDGELPKSAAGKILRRELRDRFAPSSR